MRRDREEDVEVPRRTTANAGLTLARQADARAVLDAGRDVDRERAVAHGAAGAAASWTRIVDDLTASLAAGACPFQGEKALRVADAARPTAMRAGFRLAAGLSAGPGASVAGDRRWNADLRGLADVGLVECNLHVVAKVGAPLAT